MLSADSFASWTVVTVSFKGCLRESDSIKTLNLSLSSARSIESGDVPIILTPHSSSSFASLRGVCPPY